MTARNFEDRPAVRERVPLLLGLVGPSGTGKTFSALRLATGIQRVTAGEIFYVDTEARRALHYADKFKFRHVDFKPPFGPLDYLTVIDHCVKQRAGVIVIDSMSLEHEGQGGVLEMHEAETQRLAEAWKCSPFKTQMPAWAKPKAERRRLINGILQLGCNVIFCFRAKEKIKIVTGKDPVQLGWQAIAGEEFIYEMTAKCCLLPGANGSPSWVSELPGEQAMMKLPEQFKPMFEKREQLSEDIGQRLAEWAAGTPASSAVAAIEQSIAAAKTLDELAFAWRQVGTAKNAGVTNEQHDALSRVKDARKVALGQPKPAAGSGPNGEHLFGVDQDLDAQAK